MLKQCPRCSAAFEARGHGVYCPPCRPIHAREMKRRQAQKERANTPDLVRARQARWRERRDDARRAYEKARNTTPERRAMAARIRDEQRFGGLREAVLERDGRRCADCGLPWEPGGRRIGVHHRDEDKTHNTMDNLVTFCRRCHARAHHHGPHTPETRAKMSRARSGQKLGPMTAAHRAKISAALKRIQHGGAQAFTVKSCGKAHPYCTVCRPDLYSAERMTRAVAARRATAARKRAPA